MARRVLVSLELVVALSALPAGIFMALDPQEGGVLQTRPEWPEGSPFQSYLVPGLFLAGVIGFGLLLAAVLVLRHARIGLPLSSGLGIVLCAWIVVQVTIVPFNVLQPAMFAAGAMIAALAWRERRATAGRG